MEDPDLLNRLLIHLPFVSAFGVFYVFGKTMKSGPLSAERALQVPWVRVMRRWLPLPMHPILAGIALGFIPGIPVSSGVTEMFGRYGASFYFCGAGVLSVVWHDVYKEWTKHKGQEQPSDIDADTQSVPPGA